MSAYDYVMTILVGSGALIGVLALLTVRRLDRLEREIATRRAAEHPAE